MLEREMLLTFLHAFSARARMRTTRMPPNPSMHAHAFRGRPMPCTCTLPLLFHLHFHLHVLHRTVRCLDEIMPINPAYCMALPTKNDPMLGYLTTAFQDHVRIRRKFGTVLCMRMRMRARRVRTTRLEFRFFSA